MTRRQDQDSIAGALSKSFKSPEYRLLFTSECAGSYEHRATFGKRKQPEGTVTDMQVGAGGNHVERIKLETARDRQPI
tara:strand:+ start:238 stop:471 length:234 start_codon:yes stop_codon:yes gene_type:complete